MGKEVVITDKKPEIISGYSFKSIYQDQLIELAEVRNPSTKVTYLNELARELTTEIKPIYIKYSWKKLIIECVPEAPFNELKTNRNQLLITKEEQNKLYNLKISVAGMSVGSSLTYGLVGSGIGNNFNIADDDRFSTSNLNRVQATLLDVNELKVEVSARKITEMNPFVRVSVFKERITEENMNEFMFKGQADIIFEEIDDFRMKVLLREEAKKCRIPYIMMTNLGDSVMIDVERYDIQPETELFNGYVNQETIKRIKTTDVDEALMKELSVALVDRDLIPMRAAETLKEIGTTLVGRPQLYGTVALDGGIAPFIARKIKLEGDLKSGRYCIKLGEYLG